MHLEETTQALDLSRLCLVHILQIRNLILPRPGQVYVFDLYVFDLYVFGPLRF